MKKLNQIIAISMAVAILLTFHPFESSAKWREMDRTCPVILKGLRTEL